MFTRKVLFLAVVGASMIASPALLADGGHGGGGGGSGSGSGGGGGGNGGGGSSGGSSAATTVRNAQRALKDAADAAERVIKNEKDARVRRIFELRASGATSAEVSAYLSESLAAVASLTASGLQQIEALKTTLLAGLSSTATSGQRTAIQSAANSAAAKVNKRQRSANQDLNRAVTGRIPANLNAHHPFPEHGPGHP